MAGGVSHSRWEKEGPEEEETVAALRPSTRNARTRRLKEDRRVSEDSKEDGPQGLWWGPGTTHRLYAIAGSTGTYRKKVFSLRHGQDWKSNRLNYSHDDS